MKVSERWLRTWVNPNISTTELCEQLTNLGLEVEDTENPYSYLDEIRVVEVLSIEPLADNDGATKLVSCQVSDGTDEFSVVCGAPNVEVGMLTAYAPDGVHIADGTLITHAVIRGAPSWGMLCSPAELGFSTDSSGICNFNKSGELGTSVAAMLGFDKTTTIDIDLTPNRGDCLSIRGIAREVGALNKLPIESIEITNVEPTHENELPIALSDKAGCPRYLGRIIQDVKPSATPEWMVERLVECGLRPIEPIVDITNYVMLELGQPLHAFDLKTVEKGIVVRKSKIGESLKMLDGKLIEFKDESTLLITDGNKPLAIAGVMGGIDSGIQDATQDVFLECAYFSPTAIAGTARRFDLQTDASHRYERGVDPQLQELAIERASELLVQITKGKPGPVTVAESKQDVPTVKVIVLRRRRLAQLIGEEIAPESVTAILEGLGFAVQTLDSDWQITVPPRRFDITIEEDLVEEICRLHGYNKVQPSNPRTLLPFESPLPRESTSLAIRSKVASCGYFEVINYSFIDPELNSKFNVGSDAVEVMNPMSIQLSTMRHSLLPGLLSSTQYNLSRQQSTTRLFEFGKCFRSIDGAINQVDQIAGVACGSRFRHGWAHPTDLLDFFDVKGDVETILGLLAKSADFSPSTKTYLHPGQSAQVSLQDQLVGDLGLLHPNILMDLELPENTYVFELEASYLISDQVAMLQTVPAFPYVKRDLSLLVSNDISCQQIIDLVRFNLPDLITDLTVFDVLEGNAPNANEIGIHPDQRSIAIRMEFQDPNQTLTEANVSERIDQLLELLHIKVGAKQR